MTKIIIITNKIVPKALLTFFIIFSLLGVISLFEKADASKGEQTETLDESRNGVPDTKFDISSVPDDGLDKIYFGNNKLLWKAGLLGDFRAPFLPLPPDVGQVVIDLGESKMYLIDVGFNFINRMDTDGKNSTVILTKQQLVPLGIHIEHAADGYIDGVAKKLYWISRQKDPVTGITTLSTISRINLDLTGDIEEVIRVENRDIFDMSVRTSPLDLSRRIYWLEDEQIADELLDDIELGDTISFVTTIRSANLDGSDVGSHVTGIPTYTKDFTIDHVAQKIYWIAEDKGSGDHYTIRKANLNDPNGVVDVSIDSGEIYLDRGTSSTTKVFVNESERLLYWMGEQFFTDAGRRMFAVQFASMEAENPVGEVLLRTSTNWLSSVILRVELGNLFSGDPGGDDDLVGAIWNAQDIVSLDAPGGIAFDLDNKTVYWTVPNSGTIRSANLDATMVVDILTDLNQPEDIAIDSIGGKIYWTEGSRENENGEPMDVWSIRRANLDGTDWEVFDAWDKTPEPRGLAMDAANRVLYFTTQKTHWDDGSIQAINVDNKNHWRWIARGLNKPLGIVVDTVHDQLYWTEPLEGVIKRSNLDGTVSTVILGGLVNPIGITVDPHNGKIYFTVRETGGHMGKIQCANLDGSDLKTVLENLDPSIKYIALSVKEKRPSSVYPIGDVSGDFKVDAYDAALILQFSIGMIDEFPVDSLIELSPENSIPRDYQVSIPTLKATVGERIYVPISIDDASGFLAGGIKLRYDTSVLRAVNAYPALNDVYWKANTNIDGEVRVAFISLNGNPSYPPLIQEGTVSELSERRDGLSERRLSSSESAGLSAKRIETKYRNPASKNGAGFDDFDTLRSAPLLNPAPPAATQPTHLTETLFIVEFDVLNAEGKESLIILDYVELSNSLSIDKTDGLIKVLPSASRLLQNYPNPFNPETWIPYNLSTDSDVEISIYDVSSAIVRRFNLSNQPAGSYLSRSKALYWDGRNDRGESVSSGVYFYVMKAGDCTATKKMVIVE